MNASNSRKLIGALAALTVAASASALSITPTGDATTLSNAIIGSGVTITGTSYSGAAGASGTFTGGTAAGLGFESGIVLTTGSASTAGQVNNSDNATTDNGLGGTSYLDALIPGYSTFDATVLTIDFTTTGGDIFFNYVFGSEEYNEYVNSSYNDVFGFFVNGTAVSNNIALIPSTSTAVSINNVNAGSNSTYYRNNDSTDVSPLPYPNLQYDGLTTVLTASLTGLGAGSHTITLAIADAGDRILDSGVFIQGSSFSDTPTGVPDKTSSALLLVISALALYGASRRHQHLQA